ncbi:hypothetical protein [Arthrobacter sp. NPDC058192]|uniref:hypothetical protein n=1 Tax=Arthrobacter sp. NPDC058192 TaxID=3346372 RepID=UPI0036EF3FAF
MTASPHCKPWGNDHTSDGEEESCHTSLLIYNNGRPERVSPAPGTTSAFMQDGMPWEISWATFQAYQEEGGEEPLIELQFHEAEDDPMGSANLYMNVSELRAFNSTLTSILKDLDVEDRLP